MENHIYLCIDLKTFFASCECAERGLDPFKTNLVVADPSRGEGAICLAITPAMKALGIKNRCCIFEIINLSIYVVIGFLLPGLLNLLLVHLVVLILLFHHAHLNQGLDVKTRTRKAIYAVCAHSRTSFFSI